MAKFESSIYLADEGAALPASSIRVVVQGKLSLTSVRGKEFCGRICIPTVGDHWGSAGPVSHELVRDERLSGFRRAGWISNKEGPLSIMTSQSCLSPMHARSRSSLV